jgi:hypothetical protein
MDPRFNAERSPPAPPGGRQGDSHEAEGGGALGAFGYSLAPDSATSTWMKMISSTFLGDSAGSLFSRRPAAIGAGVDGLSSAPAKKRGKHDVDATLELKIALVGGPGVVSSRLM